MRYLLLALLLTACSREPHIAKFYSKSGNCECRSEIQITSDDAIIIKAK